MFREKWVAMTNDERLFCNSFWIKKHDEVGRREGHQYAHRYLSFRGFGVCPAGVKRATMVFADAGVIVWIDNLSMLGDSAEQRGQRARRLWRDATSLVWS